MSTLVWSVVTTVEGRIPVASEVIYFWTLYSQLSLNGFELCALVLILNHDEMPA